MTAHFSVPHELISETRLIASKAPGIDLQLINRRRRDIEIFAAERTLVMIHGATYSSASLFDVPVEGQSFMDTLARAGYDVWAVDIRGFGGSTKPAGGTEPVAPAPTAADDLEAAVDFVLETRKLARINVLGMSWGGSVAGIFAARAGQKLLKLVLVTPLWLSDKPLRIDAGQPLNAYRTITPAAFEVAWRVAAPEPAREALIPAGWFEIWLQTTLAANPEATPEGQFDAPSGPIQDVRQHWTAGKPLYDPSHIEVPVLIIAAEWDLDVRVDMAQDLFHKLENARYKRFVEVGQATHMLLLERHRMQGYDAIIQFLDEGQAGR